MSKRWAWHYNHQLYHPLSPYKMLDHSICSPNTTFALYIFSHLAFGVYLRLTVYQPRDHRVSALSTGGRMAPRQDAYALSHCGPSHDSLYPRGQVQLATTPPRVEASFLISSPCKRLVDRPIGHSELAVRVSPSLAIIPKQPPLSQYNDEEWETMRPVITSLYICQARPLATVIKQMQTVYCFNARCDSCGSEGSTTYKIERLIAYSKSMFKKRLCKWGLYKNRRKVCASSNGTNPNLNNRDKSTAVPIQRQALEEISENSLRYLRQNDYSEEMHLVLDFLQPYVTQATSFYQNPDCRLPITITSNPSLTYLYNDFTHGISTSITAFKASQLVSGGTYLRHAFISLEPLFAQRAPFILVNIFYALAVLTSASFFDIARILLKQARHLVLTWYEARHPLAQILLRLDILAHQGGDEFLLYALFRGWLVCYELMNEGRARSVGMWLCRKEYWTVIEDWQREWENTGKTVPALVLYDLESFKAQAERLLGSDHETALICLDEMVTLYAQFGYQEFENAALDLLVRVERRIRLPNADIDRFVHWRCNANFELANHYQRRGEMEKAIAHMRRVLPDARGTAWGREQMKSLASWLKSSSAGN